MGQEQNSAVTPPLAPSGEAQSDEARGSDGGRREGRRERGGRRGRAADVAQPTDVVTQPDAQLEQETAVVSTDRESAGYSYFGSNNTPTEQPKADVAPEMSGEGEDKPPRERKSRDRYGRDRRERSQRNDQSADDATTAVAQSASAEALVVQPPANTSAPVAPQTGMPKVGTFTLPVAELTATATGAGLEWVESNAEKVQQAQAAIAATPTPVHVPRERAPLVQMDEGPLILVETRTDLAKRQYPFDTAA